MGKKKTLSGIDRRGEWVALLGGGLSLVFALLLAWLAIWSASSSAAVWSAAFQFLGVCGVWTLCYIQLHQQRLLAEERLEVADLERLRKEKLGGVETIFDEEDLAQMDTLAMGRRLRSIQRVLIPVLALGIAVFHFIAGFSIFASAWQFPPVKNAASIAGVVNAEVILFFTGGFAFVAFMISRYALGMSRVARWSALRAGGNFMFGASAACLAISIGLLFVISGFSYADDWVAGAIASLLIILSVETIINYILDLYRPRVEGGDHRPFYDSRLLGMFSEPGGILQSVAKAIDYQFGFKVSDTWFYSLLRRQIPYLLLVQAAVILLLTCFVVVPPGHEAVITHLGAVRPATAKPGIHVTWPWPIDGARIIPVQRVQRMELGYAPSEQDREREQNPIIEDRPPVLWTKKHRAQEYKLLVGDRQISGESKVPVNLLSVSMPVHWRVRHEDDADVIRFDAQSDDVAGIIESLSYRELTRYAASADIADLLGAGGIAGADMLRERIQKRCDEAGFDGRGLGVEIVYVGLGGIHPPQDENVAQAYQDVVSAIETKDAKIKAAEGDSAMTRISAAGTEWEQIYDAITAEDRATETNSPDRAEKTAEVERLLRTVSAGDARALAAEAQRDAYGRLFAEKSSAERYAIQLAAYRSAPSTYTLRTYLHLVATSMADVRKYVIALQDSSKVIYELDLKPPAAVDILGAELSAFEAEKETK
ncbi:MAG TPA: SPFH domain-containing protein [Phycisphaerae bacterium]|nr:SPFH domain-containing protein [Phycisphaerae bacterium]